MTMAERSAERARNRARQEKGWGSLVAEFRSDPMLAAVAGDLAIDGVLDDPWPVLNRMDRKQLKLIFRLANLAVGEAMLRATDPDRRGS
jgi:hypothetical protein